MNAFLEKNLRNLIPILIGVVFVIGLIVAGLTSTPISLADTNISATSSEHWAWNDVIGWINFYETNTVTVGAKTIEGWASSSIGAISLNCNPISNPDGDDICGSVPYKVSNNGSGTLSGWAWNDLIGWISFCGNILNNGCATSSVSYGVPVISRTSDQPPSDFWKYAWNDVIGWISFNSCDSLGICNPASYQVTTDWFATSTYGDLDSIIFDTDILKGAQFNSIGWKGSLPIGTRVRFKLATSNCELGSSATSCDSGDVWDFIGPDGGGVPNSFYDAVEYLDLGTSKIYLAPINNFMDHHNKRYFRYRVKLISDSTQNYTPTVEDVFVNYSP